MVVVATVRALKNHGGVAKADAERREPGRRSRRGLPNLLQHVENITNVYGLPCVVAINRFPTDTEAELKLVEDKCRELGVNVALSEVWAKGGEGGLALADEVVRLCENGDEAGRSADTFQFSYGDDLSLREKIEAVAEERLPCRRRRLRGQGGQGAGEAGEARLRRHARVHGQDPVQLQRRPDEAGRARAASRITVRDVKVSAGAGFVVALTGDIMTMPGLGKSPAAFKIDVDETGKITGLF